MVRVLVLGSRGFTGRHLCNRLHSNPSVTVFEASDYGVDLRRPATVQRCLAETRPEVVVNLAAVSFVGGSDYKGIYDVNAFGHLNLLKELKHSGFAGRLIFASSANIYGNNTPTTITEQLSPNPVNHYSCSKVLAENFCTMFRDQFEIIVVRPFSCIGVGQKPHFLVPKIVQHFRERQPFIELGNIDVERDFSDIRDIAANYMLLIHTDKKCDVVHFCSNETYSIKQIISMLEEISNHKIDVRMNPQCGREKDLLYQRGSDTRVLSLGFVRRYSMRDTLEWMYKSS